MQSGLGKARICADAGGGRAYLGLGSIRLGYLSRLTQAGTSVRILEDGRELVLARFGHSSGLYPRSLG